MITRLKKTELVNGQWCKVASEIVTFVEITGEQSAVIIDKQGKRRTVRRKSLLDVPQAVLYPNIAVVGTVKSDPENWKRGSYFY